MAADPKSGRTKSKGHRRDTSRRAYRAARIRTGRRSQALSARTLCLALTARVATSATRHPILCALLPAAAMRSWSVPEEILLPRSVDMGEGAATMRAQDTL